MRLTQTSRSSPRRTVDFTVRRFRFALDETVPRYWHGGDAAVTAFFNALSTFFPEGEKFFIECVQNFADRVDDPEMRRHIRDFSAQESVHRREHERYNAWLRAQGYDIGGLERRVTRSLNLARRLRSRRRNLAATAALEHFTAIMANVMMKDERVIAGAHPVMEAIWRWHAVEETEHKAVAYDLFNLVGGPYHERVRAMLVASAFFWVMVAQHTARLLAADGLNDARHWLRLLRWLFVRPGALRQLLPDYLAWYRPGFHPWQSDNRALIDEWVARFSQRPEYGPAR